ncbi:MAG: NlpC/P60 family protein [Pseudomonadota bacterium]
MTAALDPRTTPARPDLAAAHLKGVVEAERFADPVACMACTAVAPVTARPDGTGEMTSQLLFGEPFAVYEADGQWAWGQCGLDGYVGYVPHSCLDDPAGLGLPAPTHRVSAVSTHVYAGPDIKGRPGAALPMGARLAVAETDAGFARLAQGGFVPAQHLAPLAIPAADWVGEAERLMGAPYLWGGRSSMGLDCSGLVQLALQAGGQDCPRDSDQQQAGLGRPLAGGERLRRGDLVFWKGHVGLMASGTRLLHANAHHMAVAAEPLSEARRRLRLAGEGEVTARRRLDAETPAD